MKASLTKHPVDHCHADSGFAILQERRITLTQPPILPQPSQGSAKNLPGLSGFPHAGQLLAVALHVSSLGR
jgi:hypothetical protein